MSNGTAPADLASKLADVRASIRPNLEITRQLFGNRATYVVRDPVTGQNHSLNAADYQLFVSIDQSRTMKEVVQGLIGRKKLDADQVEDFYKFVVHLHQMGLLTLPLSDGANLHNKYQQKLDQQKKGKLLKLLFLKIPLFKPDRWLTHTLSWFAPLFTRTAFVLWLVCMLGSLSIVGLYWREFASPLGSMLTLSNLPVLWCLLVGLKAFHELGHAYACKKFGGNVPEIGVIMMLGTPCAYVDASASWGFPSRHHRVMVALAGMYFESWLAMLALAVWLNTDPGWLHSAAQYAITLSTIITIGFNANPLMRYDGYYVLSDMTNYPNLHRDAKAIAMGFLKRCLWGITGKVPEVGRRWRAILSSFGLLCLAYQFSVSIGIAALVCIMLPSFGWVLAVFMCGVPWLKGIVKFVKYVSSSPELEDRRPRAIITAASLATAVAFTIGLIPIPGSVVTQGVVRRGHEHPVRSECNGFIKETVPLHAGYLHANSMLAVLENEELTSEYHSLQAEYQQLAVQLQNTLDISIPQREQLAIRLDSVRKQLQLIEQRISKLQIQTEHAGEFVRQPDFLREGKYIQAGELLGTIYRGPWLVKAKLTAEQWTKIQPRIDSYSSIQITSKSDRVLHGRILSGMQSGSRKIDEQALTHLAGGGIAVSDAGDASEIYFDVIVELISPHQLDHSQVGATATLRFVRESQTLGELITNRFVRFVDQIRQVSLQFES